jgi:hypothetical protein
VTATAGLDSITFSGTSGSLAHSTQTSLTVVAAVTGMHAPIRTRALRTNASLYDADSFQWSPPQFTAYDAAHRQFFVSNPDLNEVDVFSALQETETGRIPIPGPWGVDVSPFDGRLYVGTLGGDIYVVNASTLAIAQRYPASAIGPSGFVADVVLALPGGLFALENLTFSLAQISGTVAVWDPSANTLDYGPPNSSGALSICLPVGGGGPLALSGDRSRILMADTNYCGSSCRVCSYDPVARQATTGANQGPSRAIIPTPDGSRFFAIEANQFAVFDAKTLQILGQNTGPFVWSGGSPILDSAVISADGKTLYVYDLLSGEVGAFDAGTLAQIGWVPSPSSFSSSNITGAIDETGLIAGPISGGVGFLDAALKQSGQPTYLEEAFPEPVTGPLSGGAVLSGLAVASGYTDGATLTQVYIGNAPGQQTSTLSGPYQYSSVVATTPPSSYAGAVDTTVVLSDGAVSVCMECFSYGPSIIQLVSNGATADGGGTGLLVGYGLGGTGGDAGPDAGVSVTIGGQPASVIGVEAGPVEEPYPFNSDELIFKIPPGTANTAADLTVTTSSGSATASGAFHYVAATQTFPLSDTLQQGVYDAGRDLYYFAGKTQIQVLSQTFGKWLSPITLPGVVSSTQLMGIAESPDGSKLAVSDQGGQAIYVLDPDTPASARRFSLLQSVSGSWYGQWPAGLAVTNSGMVYFSTQSPVYEFEKLDTSTGHVTNLGKGFGAPQVCDSCRVVQSSDSSHIYGNVAGIGFWVDPSTDTVVNSASFGGGLGGNFPDLAISRDGSTLDVDSNFADTSLSFESTLAYADWEWFYPPASNGLTPPWNTTWLYGEKLNGDGSILFMPLNNGIDLYARNTGRLLYRVQIPVTPASVFDSLVLGKGTNVLAVISANGVTILDMSSLPVAAEYSQPFSESTRTLDRNLAVNLSQGYAEQQPLSAPSRLSGMTRVKRFSSRRGTSAR